MAKWGEGDPRWIVEERPDAINVNNWHWAEKNATPWSRERLKELLEKKSLEKNSIVITFDDIKKLDGEATANNRKAKLIFLYEWIIELNFQARVAGSDVEYNGYIEIPNLSDENEANEVDITPIFDKKGPHEDEIRHLLNNEGADFIRQQLACYISELKMEFSKGLILPTGRSTGPQAVSKGKTTIANSNVDKRMFQNHVETTTEVKETEPAVVDVDVNKIKITDSFKTQPDQLWSALTKPEVIKMWTNSNVEIDLKPQGRFSLFSGMVSGWFTEIIGLKSLKMKWRLKTYPVGHYADVSFTLNDESDSTTLNIDACGVPSTQFSETENGFRRFYISNIMRTFGYGARIF